MGRQWNKQVTVLCWLTCLWSVSNEKCSNNLFYSQKIIFKFFASHTQVMPYCSIDFLRSYLIMNESLSVEHFQPSIWVTPRQKWWLEMVNWQRCIYIIKWLLKKFIHLCCKVTFISDYLVPKRSTFAWKGKTYLWIECSAVVFWKKKKTSE